LADEAGPRSVLGEVLFQVGVEVHGPHDWAADAGPSMPV
jgi:hypothetical protein